MRITARRLALIVFAAAGVAILGSWGTSTLMTVRGSGLALGFSGMFLPSILFFVICPILLVNAGVLALRRRAATVPEIVILGILAGSLLVVGLMSAAEPYLGALNSDMLFVIGVSWMVILLSAVASLVVIVVATIRAPRTATTHALQPAEEDRTHA